MPLFEVKLKVEVSILVVCENKEKLESELSPVHPLVVEVKEADPDDVKAIDYTIPEETQLMVKSIAHTDVPEDGE